MRMPILRSALGMISCVVLCALPAHADDTSNATRAHYVTVGAGSDDADGSQWLAQVGLPLGTHAWIDAGVGKMDSDDPALGKLGTDIKAVVFGMNKAHVEFSLGFTDRRADDSFKQQDWTALLGWRGERGGAGLNGFSRSSSSETVSSIVNRRGNPLAVRIEQSLDGKGFGAYGDVDVMPQLNLFAAAMKYSYDDVASNHPARSRLLNLNGSGITRAEAFLDRAYNAGATWRFTNVSLTGQYFHDQGLEDANTTDTVELKALILLGERWSLTPAVGHSESDVQGGVKYGSLTVGYNW